MKTAKFLHIRIPVDFHQQLVKYAEDRFIPISAVVLQSVAKTIDYTPKKATPRTYVDLTPVIVPAPTPEPTPVEDEDIPEWTEEEYADLLRRADASMPGRT